MGHEVGHHAGQVAQHGHHVGIGGGAHGAEALCHLLHGHGLAHGHGGGIPHAEFLVVSFLIKGHNELRIKN